MRFGRGGGAFGWLAWVAAGLLLVLLVPALARTGELAWTRAPAQLTQHLVMGIAFLVYAAALRAVAERHDGLPVLAAAAAAALCFGAAYVALLLRDDVPHSRALVLLSGMTGAIAGLLPYLRLRLGAGLVAAGAVAIGSLAVALPAYTETAPPVLTRDVATAQQRITVRTLPTPVPSGPGEGGALARHGDGFLLVTGRGAMYRLTWTGDSLRTERLPLEVPQNRDAFLAARRERAVPPRLRVTGLVIDTAVRPERVLVAHQYWNGDDACLTLRVSAAALDGAGGAGGDWTTLFETEPCIPFAPPYSEWETGGRLAWHADGGLLLTTGDHGYDDAADAAFAQQPGADYGKVLRLDLAGGSEQVSLGHRNAQGLAVDRDGRIWLTEHGPEGGDELNVIEAGSNYGWPVATYGTDYGTDSWPLAGDARNHGSFAEPAIAFVPALGISALIEVAGDAFPAWNGDLLAGTLRARELVRFRTRDGRVTYVERIPLGHRVRDLQQGRDGRIVVWTDLGDIAVVAAAAPLSRGELAFRPCASCHRPGSETDAPDLRGIVGRPVAQSETFTYSEPMRALGGRWTPERLDAFLADPQAVVPGTVMWYAVADPADRAAVIEYLAAYR